MAHAADKLLGSSGRRRLGSALAVLICAIAPGARGQTAPPDLSGTWYEDGVDDCLVDALFLKDGAGEIRLNGNVDDRRDMVRYRWAGGRVVFSFGKFKAAMDGVFIRDHNAAADTGDHLKATFEVETDKGPMKAACSFERQ